MKKITSALLAFVFIFTIFAATSVESYAAYTTAPDKTEAQVKEKINKLVTLLSGKYFTVNQKKCSASNCQNWACSNCYNENVFATTWFKNIFGNISVSQMPGHAYPGGGSGYPAGWTCHGFANFAMWYVFATNNTNKVGYTRVVDNIKMTKENIEKYLKPGDIIRYNTHSLMFVSAGENNFTAVDCNYYGDYKVSKHTVPYSSKTIAVSRAKNYATTPTLSINYNVNGGVIKGSEVTATKYKVTESIGINMRSGAGTSYSKVTALPVNTEFTVKTGETATANGYTWGKTTYGSYTGWVVISDFVTKTGTVSSTDSKYYVNNSLVYVSSTSAIHTQKLTYGEYISSGLYNITTFGLTRDGYVFKGWSTAKSGAEVIDQDRGLKPEEIYPDLKNGSKTITLYAIWEPEHTHSYGEAIPYDDVQHMQSCSCGESVLSDHDFQLSYTNIKMNGTVELVFGCVECGASYREESSEHFVGDWVDDGNGETHSRHCVCGCDIHETDYHFMVISSFVGENQGEFVCWDCGAAKVEMLTDGLYYANDVMYFFENGKKVSGWFEVDGITYYASSANYEVVHFDKKIGGKQYFWNEETGLVLADGFVYDGNGYKCYEDGIQVIGWRHEDGSGPDIINGISEQYSSNPVGLYYFLSTTGYMVTDATYKLGGYNREFNDDHTVKPVNGLQTQGGELYYYVDGVKQTGWHTIDGNTYYFRASDSVYGRAATKWMYIGNKIYYFYASTSAEPYALKNSGTIGGITYTYAEDGQILYNGFVNCDYANAANSNTAANIQKKNSTTRYYKNGEMQTGWQVINGNKYYFYAIGSANGSGYMCTESRTIGGVWYEFTADGICQ